MLNWTTINSKTQCLFFGVGAMDGEWSVDLLMSRRGNYDIFFWFVSAGSLGVLNFAYNIHSGKNLAYNIDLNCWFKSSSPNTTCRPSSHEVFLTVMKNWLPFVSISQCIKRVCWDQTCLCRHSPLIASLLRSASIWSSRQQISRHR